MSNHLHLFWWRWLLVVTIGVAAFGLSLVLLPYVMHGFFKVMFFSLSRITLFFSDDAVKYINFVYRVLGAVMIGWSIALFSILNGAFRRGEREAWYALALSIGVWFALDSGFSLYSGFAANAVLNTVFFILFAIPLAGTYRRFMTAP